MSQPRAAKGKQVPVPVRSTRFIEKQLRRELTTEELAIFVAGFAQGKFVRERAQRRKRNARQSS